jgi:hypothetical protein
MTHPVLSRIPWLRSFVDERYLDHRRRASSNAGFAVIALAFGLFEYDLLVLHQLRWDLFAIILVFAVVKTAVFLWLRGRN